ncbi:MAG: glycoside hydrolase family 3 N-terminal domain-containing protein [Candidatus Limimorpha sp.]
MKKHVSIITLVLVLASCASKEKDDIDKRIDYYLSQMTIEEKVGQLCCPIGFDLYDKLGDSVVVPNGRFKAMMDTLPCGGFWAVLRADPWSMKTVETGLDYRQSVLLFNEMQRYVIENTRLKIPIYFAEECAHGHMAVGGTVYPTGIGQAATWDEELLYSMGDAIGAESAGRGAQFAYGPVLDICRDARWSRVEETLGEDPFLSGTLGSAIISGMQNHLAVTVKHLAAYGIPQAGHNGAEAQIGKRNLLSEYLPNFEMAVTAGAKSIMTAYNAIDGQPCTSNTWLLNDILRNKWKFNGIVFSDLNSISALHTTHRTAASQLEATAQAINAGVNIDLGAYNYGGFLKDAVRQNLVDIRTVDEAVRKVLRFKFEAGLFDNPYLPLPKDNISNDSSNLPLMVARESIVLLKNNGLLPLRNDIARIAVIGPNADNTYNQLGDYTAPQYHKNITTVLEGIRNRAPENTEIIYAKGCHIRDTNNCDIAEAVTTAQSADAVVLVVGSSSARDFNTSYHTTGAAIVNDKVSDMDCGEGFDRASLTLSGRQEELIREISKTEKPLIIVFIEGRPTLKNSALNADAILTAFYPGEEGGNAIADVIFGLYNPAGRLPVSQPRSTGQIPLYYSQPKTNDYVDCQSSPLFPFGFGLSYTSFQYDNLIINKSDDNVFVSFDVTNTGSLDGDEVVQVYVRDEYASSTPAEKLLKGFKRVNIKKGETKNIRIPLNTNAFSTIDENLERKVEHGAFTILVGASSEDIRLKNTINL